MNALQSTNNSLFHLYQNHAPYRPFDSNITKIHVSELNAVTSTSMLLSTLKSRDFAPAGVNSLGDEIFAVDPKKVIALEYMCEQLCLDVCEAGGAREFNNTKSIPTKLLSSALSYPAVSTSTSIAPIKQERFDALGMPCPELLNVALRTEFAPLRAHGTYDQLARIYARIQAMCGDLAYWMIIARRRSALFGDTIGWVWPDSAIVRFEDVFVGLPGRFEATNATSRPEDVTEEDARKLVPALEQLRIDYPERPMIEHPDHPFTLSPIIHSTPQTTETTKEVLRIEWPERKMIEHPDYPFSIPPIDSSANKKPQLLLEYPERQLITHPDHPFRLLPIPTNPSNSTIDSPPLAETRSDATTESTAMDVTPDGQEGETMNTDEVKFRFYFDDPNNVFPWLEEGRKIEEGYEYDDMEVDDTLEDYYVDRMELDD